MNEQQTTPDIDTMISFPVQEDHGYILSESRRLLFTQHEAGATKEEDRQIAQWTANAMNEKWKREASAPLPLGVDADTITARQVSDAIEYARYKNTDLGPYESGFNEACARLLRELVTEVSSVVSSQLVNTSFVTRMEAELQANQTKGDWREWKPDRVLIESETKYHLQKLFSALYNQEKAKVSEYAADLANYAMKAHEIFGEKNK